MILDDAGFSYLFPGEPVALGKTLEMNDRRVVVVGICRVAAPSQTFPVMYCRYSQALLYVPHERKALGFIVGTAIAGQNFYLFTLENLKQFGALKAMGSASVFFEFTKDVSHPRGDSGRSYRLRFVRVEPYVVPKPSLTGDSRERVDTRVLQVVYAVEEESPDLFVGQQVDVFVDLDGSTATGDQAALRE